jgi:hypothetical protein
MVSLESVDFIPILVKTCTQKPIFKSHGPQVVISCLSRSGLVCETDALRVLACSAEDEYVQRAGISSIRGYGQRLNANAFRHHGC